MSSEDNINASLELLLDTICNTFGGVLFISMLVVIMTNLTSTTVALKPPVEAAQDEMVKLQQEFSTSRERLNSLRAALDQQSAIEKQVVDPNAREIKRQVNALKGKRSELVETKNHALSTAVQ